MLRHTEDSYPREEPWELQRQLVHMSARSVLLLLSEQRCRLSRRHTFSALGLAKRHHRILGMESVSPLCRSGGWGDIGLGRPQRTGLVPGLRGEPGDRAHAGTQPPHSAALCETLVHFSHAVR